MDFSEFHVMTFMAMGIDGIVPKHGVMRMRINRQNTYRAGITTFHTYGVMTFMVVTIHDWIHSSIHFFD